MYLSDREYTGPRFTYGFTHRPAGMFGHQPPGFIMQSQRSHPAFTHGTLDWPTPLAAQDVDRYELVFLAGPTTKEAEHYLDDCLTALDEAAFVVRGRMLDTALFTEAQRAEFRAVKDALDALGARLERTRGTRWQPSSAPMAPPPISV